MGKKRIYDRRRRLNLILEADLIEWAFDYAKRNNKTLTSLIKEYLDWLRKREDRPDVEQI